MFFLFPYFTPKLLCFLCIRFFVCPRAYSTYLWVEFSFVILECPVCLYCLTLSRYTLSILSFANIFWFISSCYVVRLTYCFVLDFSSQHILVFFPPLVFSLVVTVLLAVLLALFPMKVLYFCSGSLGEHRFYHRLISLLHKLARLF